jgi:hypothetical protein
VIMWGSKNGHQKGIACLKEIGLRARNSLTIVVGLVVIMIGGANLYDLE